MIAELRYLRDYVLVAGIASAVFVVSIAVGSIAHFGAMGTTAVFLAVGSATLLAGIVLFVRRHLCAGTRGVSATPTEARYLPLLLDVVLLGWCTYTLATMFVALHAGEHVSHDSAVIDCLWFVWWLVYTIHDVRDKFRSDRSPASRGLSARKLAAFTTAYQLPTRAEQRRALAPLVIRGFVRLALIAGMLALFFVIEPHDGMGVAMLAAFAIVAAIFLILHKLVDL